jgi:hypothetical protein
MRAVKITANIPDRHAGEAFGILRRFDEFPKYADVVLDLQVAPLNGNRAESVWKVKFGPGTAMWSQEDFFDDATNTIRFRRLSGDIDDFVGEWRLTEIVPGCEMAFHATFDTGLFLLAPIVEPMVEALLREHIRSIVRGLFGEGVSFGE